MYKCCHRLSLAIALSLLMWGASHTEAKPPDLPQSQEVTCAPDANPQEDAPEGPDSPLGYAPPHVDGTSGDWDVDSHLSGLEACFANFAWLNNPENWKGVEKAIASVVEQTEGLPWPVHLTGSWSGSIQVQMPEQAEPKDFTWLNPVWTPQKLREVYGYEGKELYKRCEEIQKTSRLVLRGILGICPEAVALQHFQYYGKNEPARKLALLLTTGPFTSEVLLVLQDREPKQINFNVTDLKVNQKVMHGGAIILEEHGSWHWFGGEEASEVGTVFTSDTAEDRAAKVFEEAECLMEQGCIHRACLAYEEVQELWPGSCYAQMAEDRLQSLESLRETTPQPEPEKDSEEKGSLLFGVGINSEVGVTGCFHDEPCPKVMIGDFRPSCLIVTGTGDSDRSFLGRCCDRLVDKLGDRAEKVVAGTVQYYFPINVYPSDSTKRIQALLVVSEDLRQISDEWHRIWFTDPRAHVIYDRKTGKHCGRKKHKAKDTSNVADVLGSGQQFGVTVGVGVCEAKCKEQKAQTVDGQTVKKGDEEASSIVPRRIEDKLQKAIRVDFDLGTMDQFFHGLRTWHNIKVELDREALQEIGLDASQKKFGLLGEYESVEEMLDFVLKVCDRRLDYYLDDEKVIVTTKYQTQGPLVLGAYDVSELMQTYDLQWNRKKDHLSITRRWNGSTESKKIMRLIHSSVEPQTWEKNGGIATLEYYPETQSLVISQNAEAHEQIQQLLDALYKEQQLTKERFQRMVTKANTQQAEQKTTLVDPASPDHCVCPQLEKNREEAVHLLEQSFAALQADDVKRARRLATKALRLDQNAVLSHPLSYRMQIFEQLGQPEVIDVALENAQPADVMVTSEGKTFPPTKGETEASSSLYPKNGPGMESGWCFEYDVDVTTGRVRYRVQAQVGPLTVRAVKGREGKGSLSISLGMGK